MVKSGITKNLLDVLTQHETWAIMTEFQPPIIRADRNKTREPFRLSGGFLEEKVGEIRE